MIDLETGDKRLLIFNKEDEDWDPAVFREFVKCLMDDGWNLIDITQGREFIMKFVREKKGGENEWLNSHKKKKTFLTI